MRYKKRCRATDGILLLLMMMLWLRLPFVVVNIKSVFSLKFQKVKSQSFDVMISLKNFMCMKNQCNQWLCDIVVLLLVIIVCIAFFSRLIWIVIHFVLHFHFFFILLNVLTLQSF